MSDPVEMSADPDDDAAAFADWDEQDWSKVEEVAAQQAAIEAIEDPVERKAAAKAWASALQGGQ